MSVVRSAQTLRRQRAEAALAFEENVFINCPFDEKYAPLLEAMLFCIVDLGLNPRLANERLEAGENRLDKIVDMIKNSKFSVHDLSLSAAVVNGETFRMNMPFEFGIDVGFRRSDPHLEREKRFLVFERNAYDLKRSLSDISGQDVEAHRDNFETVIRKTRDFFRVEGNVDAPGPAQISGNYVTCLGWIAEKKIAEGHAEEDALRLPTKERLDEMKRWVSLGRPSVYEPD